jgi:hypothetical protein
LIGTFGPALATAAWALAPAWPALPLAWPALPFAWPALAVEASPGPAAMTEAIPASIRYRRPDLPQIFGLRRPAGPSGRLGSNRRVIKLSLSG